MRIHGFDFVDLGEIEFLRDESGRIQRLHPQKLFSNPDGLSLHRYGNLEYCKFSVPGLPKGPGVYAFASEDEVLYIGKASKISKRFMPGYRLISPRMCFTRGPETTCRINATILSEALEGVRIHVHVLETAEYGKVEEALLKTVTPKWNRAGVMR